MVIPLRFQRRPAEGACRSPAHGSPTPFTAGVRSSPPSTVAPGSDDNPVKADQAEPVWGLEGDDRPAVGPGPAVALGQDQSEPVQRIVPDLREVRGRVAESKSGTDRSVASP